VRKKNLQELQGLLRLAQNVFREKTQHGWLKPGGNAPDLTTKNMG
jgi:hypothetical protein